LKAHDLQTRLTKRLAGEHFRKPLRELAARLGNHRS